MQSAAPAAPPTPSNPELEPRPPGMGVSTVRGLPGALLGDMG